MIDIAELFRALGVSRYDAALPEGRISWRDARGAVIARARCEVILSHVSIDGSVVYGAEHAQLRVARVPTLPLDGVASDLRPSGPMTDPDARRVAAGLASHRGAQFVYRCKFGSNSLYLAAFELELFPTTDISTSAAEHEMLARYIGFLLKAAGESIRCDRRESARLALMQLDDVLAKRREQVGTEDVDRVLTTLHRIAESPGSTDAAELLDEARRWPEGVTSAGDSDVIAVP